MNDRKILKQILWIEDEPDYSQELISGIAGELPAEVTVSSSNAGAADRLLSEKYDLIILDIFFMSHDVPEPLQLELPPKLAEYDPQAGILLLDNLRSGKFGALNRDTPVLLNSVISENELKEITGEYRNTRYLSKPVSLANLKVLFEELLK